MRNRTLFFVLFIVLLATAAFAGPPHSCTTIQDGVLTSSDGNLIPLGFNSWGYNYQAHRFHGDYCDAYYGASWCQAYVGTDLAMQWNDAWLSKLSCDGDLSLDRHFGLPSYRGSGAWITNHMSGWYVQSDENCHWTYFVKIVAAPSDAFLAGGFWYSTSGALLGPVIWGEFFIAQEVTNDLCAGMHGISLLSTRPGLGGWDH